MASRLDAALDKLFSAPVETFMETRDALIAELRAAGDKEAAMGVKAQHKPSLAAHAANQLAQSAGAELDKLFETSRELASGKDFKTALEHQRAALDKVRAKMPEAHVSELLHLVRGAMVDEELAARVKLGHFSKLPEIQVGFFGAAPQGEALPRVETKQPLKKEPARPNEAESDKAERQRLAHELAEREKAERLAKQVQDAESELERLTAEADAMERQAVDARKRAKAAAEHLKKLKAAAR